MGFFKENTIIAFLNDAFKKYKSILTDRKLNQMEVDHPLRPSNWDIRRLREDVRWSHKMDWESCVLCLYLGLNKTVSMD